MDRPDRPVRPSVQVSGLVGADAPAGAGRFAVAVGSRLVEGRLQGLSRGSVVSAQVRAAGWPVWSVWTVTGWGSRVPDMSG